MIYSALNLHPHIWHRVMTNIAVYHILLKRGFDGGLPFLPFDLFSKACSGGSLAFSGGLLGFSGSFTSGSTTSSFCSSTTGPFLLDFGIFLHSVGSPLCPCIFLFFHGTKCFLPPGKTRFLRLRLLSAWDVSRKIKSLLNISKQQVYIALSISYLIIKNTLFCLHWETKGHWSRVNLVK